jgi:F-type H+-transporting ATPase subunit epsilon
MADNIAKTFSFELVSPERKLISEPAQMVVVPAEDGDIGVLADHTAIVASLRAGVISFHREGHAEPMKIFVSGGFADISAKNLTVLAEEAINVKSLDVITLEKQMADLKDDISIAKNEIERNRFSRQLALVELKMEAAKAV